MKKKIIIELDEHDLYEIDRYDPIGITLWDRIVRAIKKGKPYKRRKEGEKDAE